MHGSKENDSKNASEHASVLRKAVSYDGKLYDVTREGLAEILTPQQAARPSGDAQKSETKAEYKKENAQQNVFYNPIQQYNRDISVLAIRAFTEDLAAARTARQEQRHLNLNGAERRGKKRKRGWNHESTKRKKADDGGSSVLTANSANVEIDDLKETGTEEPRGDNACVPSGTSEENTGTLEEESKSQKEDFGTVPDNEQYTAGNSHKPLDQKGCETASLGVDVDTSDLRKGLDSIKSNSSQSIRILDALSATGLRALRYAKEIPLATSLIANDLSSSATSSIKLNIAHNALASKITATKSDALEHMYSTMSRENGRVPHPYHVVDIDPYGTAAPFLDAAVQAVADGGLLCITCTDAGIFASIGYLEKTYSQYSGLPLKGAHAHEAGLRLILHAIATTAARRGIATEPLLSLSIDFYARVFVRVHRSPADVKFLASKTMVVYQCDSGCGSWSKQYLAQARGKEARNGDILYKFTSALGPSAGTECEHCGFKTHLAGPMWGGALHNPFFVQRILDMLPSLDKEVYQTIPRIEGMLSMALDESLDDPWASIADSKKRSTSSNAPQEGSPATAAGTATIADGRSYSSSSLVSTGNHSRPVPPLPAHYRAAYPFFVHPPALAHALNTVTPSDASLRGALHHLGYRTSRSHTKAGSIITDAPFNVVWEIMREWARRESIPSKNPRIAPNTAGAGIMRNDRSKRQIQAAKQVVESRIARANNVEELKTELEAALYHLSNNSNTTTATTTTTTQSEPQPDPASAPLSTPAAESIPPPPPPNTLPPPLPLPDTTPNPKPSSTPDLHDLDIRFDEKLGAEPGGKKKLVRYQLNPRENWGPLTRAKG